MKKSLIVLAVLLASPGTLLADDDCRYSAERSVDLDAAGARLLEIWAEAGSLEIKGRSGATRITARGTACARHERDLDKIQLTSDRKGDRLSIETRTPDSDSWREYAYLDLTIEVPSDLALDVTDGSGSSYIENVASLRIEDGSGEIVIERVGGDLHVQDGSGSIDAEGVEGNVFIKEDGSGSIQLADVRGDVEIDEDGSGSIDIRGVGGSVRIGDDGSGSITVADVTGDFIVDDDGSGGIYMEDVGGRVRIPQ